MLTAGVVPASVAELARGALRAMRHSMIMRVGGVFLAVGIVAAGVGRFAPRASGGPSEPATARPKEDDGAEAEKIRVKLAIQRAQQEVEEIEYEAKKQWLREAMKRLGKLELQRRVRDPRPEKDVTLRERKEAIDAEEVSRRDLSEYIEKMHAELIDKGISVNIKKLELLEAERKAQGETRPAPR